MLIKEIDNTFKRWCELKEEIEEMALEQKLVNDMETLNSGIGRENDNVKIFKINVNVSCVPEQEESDIMLLKYAFPIFDVV